MKTTKQPFGGTAKSNSGMAAAPKAMKKGGPTSMDMRRVGRNMARVRNQKGGK